MNFAKSSKYSCSKIFVKYFPYNEPTPRLGLTVATLPYMPLDRNSNPKSLSKLIYRKKKLPTKTASIK